MGPTGRLPDSMTTARRLVLTLLVLAAGSAMLWAWGLGQPRAVGDPAADRDAAPTHGGAPSTHRDAGAAATYRDAAAAHA